MLGQILTGRSITLCSPNETHIGALQRWYQDTAVTRFIYQLTPIVRTRRAWDEWLENKSKDGFNYYWMITRDEQAVGYADIAGIDWRNRHGVVGVLLGDRSSWGHGVGTETLGLIVDFAFDNLRLQRLEAEGFVKNVASIKMCQKLGFRQIGSRQRYMLGPDGWLDTWLGELLAEERANSTVDATLLPRS